MFESITRSDDLSRAFGSIRRAFSSPDEEAVYAAARSALDVLDRQYAKFRHELREAGVSGVHEPDLDTFGHGIKRLRRFFDGNPGGLLEREARTCGQDLQMAHDGFVALARKLASGRV